MSEVPELYKDAYYWLCENVSPSDANVVLDLLQQSEERLKIQVKDKTIGWMEVIPAAPKESV